METRTIPLLGSEMRIKKILTVGERLRRLWSRKTIMIIDGIGMMDLALLDSINPRCKNSEIIEGQLSRSFWAAYQYFRRLISILTCA